MNKVAPNPTRPVYTSPDGQQHQTSERTAEGSWAVEASCICGWYSRWSVADGSAQQAAYGHLVYVGAINNN